MSPVCTLCRCDWKFGISDLWNCIVVSLEVKVGLWDSRVSRRTGGYTLIRLYPTDLLLRYKTVPKFRMKNSYKNTQNQWGVMATLPHIHSMELLTYTWSILDNHMCRHTIWGDSSHAQILYVWRFNCIRKSILAFHLSLQYCVSLGANASDGTDFQTIRRGPARGEGAGAILYPCDSWRKPSSFVEFRIGNSEVG